MHRNRQFTIESVPAGNRNKFLRKYLQLFLSEKDSRDTDESAVVSEKFAT